MEQLPTMELPLAVEVALLQRIRALNDDAIHKVEEFVCDAKLSPLAGEHTANVRKRNVDIGFNLFELISDHYYRETFHSDILHAFLNPRGKHKAGHEYLQLFLKFIRKWKPAIDLADYEDSEVEKEKGYVDILILGKKPILGKR